MTFKKNPENLESFLALEKENTLLSPCELAVKMTDEMKVFISESSVYRILKQRGLIRPTEHHFIAVANEFYNKTAFPNQMWQTNFIYFKMSKNMWITTITSDTTNP
ncbi:MAG: hypothetical protein LBH91_00910 [Prevotellaceae bacterium]|jgi:hypothetical protein|nr:hypothetical protein [Prevotellaceae bacterium]